MKDRSFRFTHALLRKPARSVSNGLRATDVGNPDPDLFTQQHDAYGDALIKAGVEIQVLEAAEKFPDSVFIEDAALVLNGVAILMRPGAETRLAEPQFLEPDANKIFNDVITLQTEGVIDGGDIMCSDYTVMVGLSARTNEQGARDLEPVVNEMGYKLRIVNTPPGVLHFKTHSSLLDNETVLSTPILAASGCFADFKVIETPKGAEAGANVIRVNDYVISGDGKPAVAELLDQKGYNVMMVPNGEGAKMDGGVSCLSLRYSL